MEYPNLTALMTPEAPRFTVVPISDSTGGDIDKETIENLITSNIQPRPGSDLFQVSEVPYVDGKLVFIIEVAIGLGDVWQAKDKPYYKRFQYKAEPMEHYEINMVRERHQGPDLKLVFGINDRWESSLSPLECLNSRGEEAVVHVGNACPGRTALVPTPFGWQLT